MIWAKPGTVKTNGSKQEVKRTSAGVYHRMRNNGNLVQYNRGEFSANDSFSFGDLFYRRVLKTDVLRCILMRLVLMYSKLHLNKMH
jgi:hypothetical protein